MPLLIAPTLHPHSPQRLIGASGGDFEHGLAQVDWVLLSSVAMCITPPLKLRGWKDDKGEQIFTN